MGQNIARVREAKCAKGNFIAETLTYFYYLRSMRKYQNYITLCDHKERLFEFMCDDLGEIVEIE